MCVVMNETTRCSRTQGGARGKGRGEGGRGRSKRTILGAAVPCGARNAANSCWQWGRRAVRDCVPYERAQLLAALLVPVATHL